MPRALLVAPVFVTGIYILYFLGVSSLLGPEAVRTMGDRHVAFLAGRLLGPFGAKVMLLFILIAVAGTLNGVILGYLRLPHALAKRGLLPLSRIFAEPRAFLRALPAYTASCVWAALNYLSERYAWLPNADVSEIPIVMGYLLYAVLRRNHWFLARRGNPCACSGRRGDCTLGRPAKRGTPVLCGRMPADHCRGILLRQAEKQGSIKGPLAKRLTFRKRSFKKSA